MKITGFATLFRDDGVEVLDRTTVDLPWQTILKLELGGLDTLDVRDDPLRRPLRQREEDDARDTYATELEVPWSFGLRLEGEQRQVCGRVRVIRPREAAAFLVEHLVPVDDPLRETAFDQWFRDAQKDLSPDGFLRKLEDRLVADEELPPYLLVDRSFEDDVKRVTVPDSGQICAFKEASETPPVFALRQLELGEFRVERLAFIHPTPHPDQLFCFDGQRMVVAEAGSSAAQELYAALDRDGLVAHELKLDFMVMGHLCPEAWIRIPSREEAGELAGALASDLHDLPLPDAVPGVCFLYDCMAPIPVSGARPLTVVADPREAIGVISHTNHGVFQRDKAPTFVVPAVYAEHPQFMLACTPRPLP